MAATLPGSKTQDVGGATEFQRLFPRIAIGAIEGTARSVRHRQQQFNSLFNGLLKSKFDLIDALKHDLYFTDDEALFEYSVTLKETRVQYESISIDVENASIRKVEQGQDNASHAVPVGVAAYIVPGPGLLGHLSPLAAAMAAGNCVILELPNTTSRSNAVLRKMLVTSLNKDTFTLSTSRPHSSVLAECVVVLQSEPEAGLTSRKTILSSASARSIAFVDREADLGVAARSIFNARFGFGGKSLYAPEIVFVHESVAALFKSHLAHLWAHSRATKQTRSIKALGQSETRNTGFNTLHADPVGAILEAQNSSEGLSVPQFKAPTIVLCTISSTDDGLNKWNEVDNGAPAGGAFIFATPVEGAYVSNSLSPHLALINHIPLELLVGPRVPQDGSGTIVPRYSPSMFQQPQPQLAKKSELTQTTGGEVLENSKLETWARSMQQPLRSAGEKDGKRVDFFEQALMTAGGVVLLSIIITGVLGGLLVQRWRSGSISALWR